jgi:peroxiredoxin
MNIKDSRLFIGVLALVAVLPLTGRAELPMAPEKVEPIAKGVPVPDVMLRTVDGKSFSLKAETKAKPTVIIFYRGGWCPYCNAHLADVQKVEKDLLAMGYQILAISPDRASALRATRNDDKLTYTLLSDADMQATGAFGLAYGLDDATAAKYKSFGVSLTAQHEGRFWLPVPAVYIVGKDGRIAFAHWDPDYKVRLSDAELLKAARAASAK